MYKSVFLLFNYYTYQWYKYCLNKNRKNQNVYDMRKTTYFLILMLFIANISLATNITVQLNSSDGNPITTGATLKYQDSNGWQTAINNNNGTFTANVSGSTVKYQMYYNNGIQTKNNVASTMNPVTFQTIGFKPRLETSGGIALNGTVKYYQNGWSSSMNANNIVELLPGSYKFKMYFHNGIQSQNSVTVSSSNTDVLFQTVSVTPQLKDSDGTDLAGGTVKYYQNGWSSNMNANSIVELLPGSYNFKMYYHNGIQKITKSVSGNSDNVLFQTVSVTPQLKDSDGSDLAGGTVKYYQNGWSSNMNANNSVELLPGSYNFKMYYHNGIQKITKSVSGNSDNVLFQTVSVTPALVDCNDNPLSGGTVKYYQNGWSSNKTPNTAEELLPGSYKFKMYYNHGINYKTENVGTAASYTVRFQATQVNFAYGGNVKYYSNGWGPYSSGMYLLPQTYKFKFDNNYSKHIAIPEQCTFNKTIFILKVVDSDNNPLPNIPIAWNHSYSAYTNLGSTNSNGVLFVESGVPSGNQKFKATKDHTAQTITTNSMATFQTAKYKIKVENSQGTALSNIPVKFNTHYSAYMDVGDTDNNGLASIELFAGTRKFKAIKDYTSQAGNLTISSPGGNGMITFKTTNHVIHVTNSTGSNLANINVKFNHKYTSYMNVGTTGPDGKTSIELFRGNRKFMATKDYTHQTGILNVPAPATSGTITFQTAKATALVKDCDNGLPISGAVVKFNHKYTSYMNVGTTGNDGKASIELFPGSRKFKAIINYTSQAKTFTLTHTGNPNDVDVTFNPTRVNFHYTGGVSYNHKYSAYTSLHPDYYMFPGTYKFKFGSMYKNIAISGCSMEKAPIFVQLQDNNGNGISGPSFKYRYGYGSSTSIGTDNTGNGIFYLLDGNPSKTKVTVSYKGASIEKEQNVQNNPNFIFNTVPVSVELLESDNTTDITNDATYKFRYGYGSYTTFDPLTQPMQLLPVKTKMHISYRGTSLEREQNVGNDAIFNFQTVNVTASLNEGNSSTALTADNWQFRYSYGSYSGFNNTGEELLPVNTKVKVSYKGESVEKQQNVATDPHFDFNTIKVTAKLNNSNGVEITNNVSFDYRYGYASFKPFNGPIYLLPANTKIKVNYRGTSVSKEQNVGSAPDFVFNTVPVTAKVEDSQGNPITSGVSYKYRYGYGTKYIFTSPMELLPVKTKVRAIYAGKTVEKEQNVNSDPDFVFTTAKATALVLDVNSVPVSGATIQYRYGYGNYMNLGTTDNSGLASKEIFADNDVTFRATYDTYDETQTVPLVYNSNPDVIFNSDLDVTTFPIELTSFNATNRAQDVLLRWTTATEINNDYFTLERSTDTENWTIIGTVDGAGNSNTSLNYRFVDDEAPNGGIVYYRLKQTDFDGKFEYSDIIDVNRSNSNNVELTVSPVPSTGIINLNSNQTFGNSRIIIIDNAGNKVYDKQGVSDKLDLSFLQNGLYHIRLITDEHQMISRKIIISR